jgi:hypothetical protein
MLSVLNNHSSVYLCTTLLESSFGYHKRKECQSPIHATKALDTFRWRRYRLSNTRISCTRLRPSRRVGTGQLDPSAALSPGAPRDRHNVFVPQPQGTWSEHQTLDTELPYRQWPPVTRHPVQSKLGDQVSYKGQCLTAGVRALHYAVNYCSEKKMVSTGENSV